MNGSRCRARVFKERTPHPHLLSTNTWISKLKLKFKRKCWVFWSSYKLRESSIQCNRILFVREKFDDIVVVVIRSHHHSAISSNEVLLPCYFFYFQGNYLFILNDLFTTIFIINIIKNIKWNIGCEVSKTVSANNNTNEWI